MSEELKPCPFCGAQELHEGTYSGSPTIMCRTPGCGALVGGEESTATAGEVREAWNRRATPLAAPTWHAKAIDEGIADADASKLTSLEDVKAKWPAPPAAQVQGERPEVVAFAHERTGAVATYDNVRVMEEGSVPSGYSVGLMTVAQHQRIVAALEGERAEQWRLRRDFEARCDTQAAVIAELRAALSAPPAAGVPEGWKLVPVDASLEMVEALKNRITVTSRGTILNAGNALNDAISAAPTSPASEQQRAVDMPERKPMRPFQTVDTGSTNHAAGWNACLTEFLRLNPHLAGVNQEVTEAGNGGDA